MSGSNSPTATAPDEPEFSILLAAGQAEQTVSIGDDALKQHNPNLASHKTNLEAQKSEQEVMIMIVGSTIKHLGRHFAHLNPKKVAFNTPEVNHPPQNFLFGTTNVRPEADTA